MTRQSKTGTGSDITYGRNYVAINVVFYKQYALIHLSQNAFIATTLCCCCKSAAWIARCKAVLAAILNVFALEAEEA